MDMATTELPQPGRPQDCRERPQNEFLDPRCAHLMLFLQGTDTYWEYKYYYCPHCQRIWESSFFYQDWEPFWEILAWEKFKEMKDRWRDAKSGDHYPAAIMEAGIERFGSWVQQLPAPYSFEY
jgi:hypothetical protein